MDVRYIGATIEEHPVEDLKALLDRDDGFVWIDIPQWDGQAEEALEQTLGAHQLEIRDCVERSHVPKLRAYPQHLFAILHAPEPGDPGHVHLVELDLLIGFRFLVSVHGPLGDGVPLDAALRETEAVAGKIHDGRFSPKTPAELAHALVSGLLLRLEGYVSNLANQIASLERQVMKGDFKDPEEALERLFKVRHELLTVRTMAAGSREVLMRLTSLSAFLPEQVRPFIEDLVDRFDRARNICDSEKEFLQGVVDFYQSKTSTKMNVAMERLALISALVLPVTAVASIYGMNIIVNRQTDALHIAGVVGSMALVAIVMLRWARRHGWW
ncbi:MAG: magnesium transporter CorA family protein [Actinomycetota bacterium]